MIPSKKKTKSKKTKTKVDDFDDLVDRSLTDMNRYHKMTDWSAMWEDFYLSLNTDGTRKYAGIYQFASAKAKGPSQKRFLLWYLGPKNDPPLEEDIKYKWAGPPQCWMEKRNTGGWHTSDNLRKVTTEIRRRNHVLDAMEEVGRTVTLNSVARAEQLAQQIDHFFDGTPLVRGLTLEQNEKRALLYIQLQTKVLGLQERAFSLFAKSHGVDFNDLGSLVQFYQAAALARTVRGDVDTPKSKGQLAVESLVEMTLAKSQRFNIALPTTVETTVVEAVEAHEVKEKKKRSMQ